MLTSYDHIECVLNGHTIKGYADENPPIMLDFEDTSESRQGPHGNIYVLEKAKQDAILRVRLMPHSPSVRWFIDRYNERVQRQRDRVEGPFFSGSLTDVAKNTNWGLYGGFIINVPGFSVGDQTYEASIRFERVVPNVSGGRYAERLEDSITT